MSKRAVRPGRPKGVTTADPVVAGAFGATVRAARLEAGIAQEELALKAGVERAHMGKIERGEHMPTLGIVLKIAKALGVPAGDLVSRMVADLPAEYRG